MFKLLTNVRDSFRTTFAAFYPYDLNEQKANEFQSVLGDDTLSPEKKQLKIQLIVLKYAKLKDKKP